MIKHQLSENELYPCRCCGGIPDFDCINAPKDCGCVSAQMIWDFYQSMYPARIREEMIEISTKVWQARNEKNNPFRGDKNE